MRHHIHTPGELEAMTPLVRAITRDLQAAAASLTAVAFGAVASSVELLETIHDCTVELEALGATVRSVEPPQVEFLAEVEGQIGYVAWAGEGYGAFRGIGPSRRSSVGRWPV